MKSALRSIVALSLSLGGIAAAQDQAPYKVATVDMSVLFGGSPLTKQAKASFDEEQQKVAAQLKDRETELDLARQELEALEKQLNDPSLSDDKKKTIYTERQAKQQAAIGLQQEARDFHQRKVRALQEQMLLRTRKILEDIQGTVAKHAKEEGYDFILDKSATSGSLVNLLLYAKDATDITDDLLGTISGSGGAPAPQE